MEQTCPNCNHRFDTQIAPGLKDACPRCMAEFLMGETGELEPVEGKGEAPANLPLEPGSTIREMEVLEFLGQGGMGFVYKARQPSLERIVALKILDPRLAASNEFTRRFNREAKALAALSHPNIVQVYDYGQEGEHYFLVMEFIDGASLRQILTTQRMTPETALRYVPQICDALEYAHSEGVIHRDIKPENILIDKRGNLKIADFGLAKMAVPEGQARSQATASGRVMGSPHYMAPEQVKGMASVDHRADIYSLGVVFYEMLMSELPIGKFPAPSQQVRVDVRLDEVVLKALEKQPERRYQKASEVKEEVTKIQGTRRDVDREVGTPEGEDNMNIESVNSSRMSRLAIAGILGLPAALVVGLITFAFGTMLAPEGFQKWDNVSAAAGLVGFAVCITGVVLSVCALVTIRKSEGRLRGKGLAKLGIGVPVSLGIALLIFGGLSWHLIGPQVNEMRNETEQMMRAEVEKRERRAAEAKINGLWLELSALLTETAGAIAPADLADKLMEPTWREKVVNAADPKKFEEQSSIFGLKFEKESKISPDEFFGRTIIKGVNVNGDRADLLLEFAGQRFSVPMQKVDSRWYFAPGPVPELEISSSDDNPRCSPQNEPTHKPPKNEPNETGS